MKEGYKETQIGMVPKDWDVVILEHHADIRGRIGWKGLKQSEYVENGPSLIANKHIKNGKIDWESCDHITVERYNESIEIGLELGDVVFSKDGALGNPALITELPNKATINSTMMLVRPHLKLDPSFLYQILCSSLFSRLVKEKVSGSSIPHIFQRDMKSFLLPLPHPFEQSEIASILSTVDEKIDSINQRIEKTQKLKQGLMQQLLTRGIGHTKFKDSPLGEIPESWEVVKLGDYQDLMTNGFVGTATEYYVDTGGVIYIQGYNVKENKFRYTGIKYISNDFHKKHKKSHLKEGDLLTVQTGHIGTTVVVPEELEGANCHALIITRVKRAFFTPEYISFFLNSGKGKERIKIIEVGSTLAHINVGDFMKFLVPKPSLEEQQWISGILSKVENKMDILQEKKTEYEQLKKGLMQQLLTGKIRVETI